MDYLLLNPANDMLRQITRHSNRKADFYLPPAMENFADHHRKSNVVNIQAELAATSLGETLDNDVCDFLAFGANARLEHL